MLKFDTESIESYVQIPPCLYEKKSTYIALIADDGNHFLNEGITEGATVFIDLEAEYEEGMINCFVNKQREFRLHKSMLEGYEYVGRAIATMKKIKGLL